MSRLRQRLRALERRPTVSRQRLPGTVAGLLATDEDPCPVATVFEANWGIQQVERFDGPLKRGPKSPEKNSEESK